MEIPKEIDELLEKRAEAAVEFIRINNQITFWLDEHHVDVEPRDIKLSDNAIIYPHESVEFIREDIHKKMTGDCGSVEV